MKPSRPTRRLRTPSLAPERLEDRQMMTGGVGSTFAIIPATISKAGGSVSVSFSLNPSLFTDKGNKPFILGLDVAPNTNSSANPMLKSVTTPTGQTLSVTHSAFDPKVKRSGVEGSSALTSAALVTIPGLPTKSSKSDIYKVNVQALGKTSGAILVGFYLPGDADGNGAVNSADINAIKYAMNSNATDTTGKYSFDADANRDGMVTSQDLAIAQKNLGIGTTVSPVISANVAPSMMVDPNNRITNLSNVTVTGAATPGATVTYSETGETAVSTTADSTGNYSINIPLLTGSNTYSVSTSDAFKQVISGSINAITYNADDTGRHPQRRPRPLDLQRDADHLRVLDVRSAMSAEDRRSTVTDRGFGPRQTGSLVEGGSACNRSIARSMARRAVGSGSSWAWIRGPRAASDPILPSAQADAPRTTGSASTSRPISTGTASLMRRVPRIKAAFLSKPARFERARAVPLSDLAKAIGSLSSHSIRSGLTHSGLGWSEGSRPGGALRFQGQTSWQMSQPNAQSPNDSAASSGIGPLCSIVQ